MTAFNNPTTSQSKAYASAFDYFNEKLFGGILPPCLLNFSRKSRTNYGFFSPDRWESAPVSYDTRNNVKCHEISVNPDHLDRPLIDSMGTLVHEMCHLWQQENGKPSRSGYHNVEWGMKMDEVGLTPSNTGQPGGLRTGQQMSHFIVAGGPFAIAFARMPEECKLPWLSSGNPSVPKKSKVESKVKYLCSGCRSAAWGKPGLHLLCEECRDTSGAYLSYQSSSSPKPEVVVTTPEPEVVVTTPEPEDVVATPEPEVVITPEPEVSKSHRWELRPDGKWQSLVDPKLRIVEDKHYYRLDGSTIMYRSLGAAKAAGTRKISHLLAS